MSWWLSPVAFTHTREGNLPRPSPQHEEARQQAPTECLPGSEQERKGHGALTDLVLRQPRASRRFGVLDANTRLPANTLSLEAGALLPRSRQRALLLLSFRARTVIVWFLQATVYASPTSLCMYERQPLGFCHPWMQPVGTTFKFRPAPGSYGVIRSQPGPRAAEGIC